MSRNIVFEGWLTKSPPSKRIWRTKWRRRWFSLRQSGELPGQYFLDYYADRNCRRLKGSINLDLCEQVDAGLRMERTNHGPLDPKLRGSVFTIHTQTKAYHLEADCEAEMEKWVDAICRVCGLRASESSSTMLRTYQTHNIGTMTDNFECPDGTSPYIPISECITGVKAQGEHRAFTFDTQNIVMSTTKTRVVYLTQPQIRVTDFSENESNVSEEECKSLNASQYNIREGSVEKSFNKLTISNKNGVSEDVPPPPPPRPPKTFAMNKDMHQGPKMQEPENLYPNSMSYLRVPQRTSPFGTVTTGRSPMTTMRTTDDEDEHASAQASMQYCNLPSMPPAVDRALKPRQSSRSIGQINNVTGQGLQLSQQPAEKRAHTLQYLDLDLPGCKSPSKSAPRKSAFIHRSEEECAYKTVDFLKTEAFNITRQDAEASRSLHLH